MFQAVLELGNIPQSFRSLEDYVPAVERALAEEGLKPANRFLLRGGFYKKEDLELLTSHGTDYYGRPAPTDYTGSLEFSTRYHKHGIFLASIGDIGRCDYRNDPLWNALRHRNQVNVLAVFDSSQLKLVRRDPYD